MLKAVLERRLTVFLICALIFLAGIFSAMTLPIRMQPAVNTPNITIDATVEEELSLDEMEKKITFPLENVAQNSSIVEDVSASTNSKTVHMSVVLQDSSDQMEQNRLRQDLRQKINSFDVNFEDTQVQQQSTANTSVMSIAIVPSPGNESEVREELKNIVVPALKDVPDVRQVVHQLEDYDRQYVFEMKPDQVKSLEKTSMITEDIRRFLSSPLLGVLSYDGSDYRVRSEASVQRTQDLENVRLSNGEKLLDVVDVRTEREGTKIYNRVNGDPYYRIELKVSETASEVQVTKQARNVMQSLYNDQNTSWEYSYMFDASEFIGQAVNEVLMNVLFGALIAAIVLSLIFRSFRTVLVISISIPICIMTTLIMLKFADYSINLITLIGLGIGTGMIVDACIVVLENIFRKMQENDSRMEAIITGTKEVIGPVTSSVLTTVVVFVPIGYLEGFIGAFMKQLALTVSVSLIASLVVSIVVIPILSYKFIRQEDKKPERRGLKRYEAILSYCLQRKKRILSGFVLLFFVTMYILVAVVPKNFVPQLSEGGLYVQYEVEEDMDFEIAKDLLTSTADDILQMNGVKRVYYWNHEDQSHVGDIYVQYLPQGERERSKDEIQSDIVDKLERLIPYTSLSVRQGQGNTEGQTELSLRGSSMETVLNAVPALEEELRLLPDVTGVEADISDKTNTWMIDYSQQRLQYYDLTQDEVESYLSMVFNGVDDIDYTYNGEETTASIRFPEMYRQDSEALYRIPIKEDVFVTLTDIADVNVERAESERTRMNGKYESSLTVHYPPENEEQVLSGLEEVIRDNSGTDVQLAFAGTQQQQSEAFGSLLTALAVSLAAVFLILTVQFNRLRQPFIIFLSLIFTGIGIALGFILTGRVFDIMAMIGVIMLVGIVVNNAIVLIDFINKNKQHYATVREAIIEGAKVRTRPIFTTTLTTVGGLIPMFIGGTNTSDFQTPIATTVIFGLLFSTLISLLIVPILYELFEGSKDKKKKKRFKWLRFRKRSELPG